MTNSRRPLPHDSRGGSFGLVFFERSLREAVNETRDSTDVRENLLRSQDCARDGTKKDFGDGVEDGLNSVLGYSAARS